MLHTNNMFLSYTVGMRLSYFLDMVLILPQLSLDNDIVRGDNTLLLHFVSAKHRALELERQYGKVRAGSCNLGHPSRVYVRKAQYAWRWDWVRL